MNRSQILVPKELECFAERFGPKLDRGEFLGSDWEKRPSLARAELSRVRSFARMVYLDQDQILEPTPDAKERTKRAVQDFFTFAAHLLSTKRAKYPLAGCNKCLGMVVVPRTKLVLMAVSVDRDPEKDLPLRRSFVALISEINALCKQWIFELVRVPTKSEYLIVRTLTMRIPHEAPKEWVEPKTRCMEVALMVALCKVRRFKQFKPEEAGIVALGATLWSSPDGMEAIPFFEGAVRNRKHVTHPPILVNLGLGKRGWLDEWNPCPEHCALFKRAMLAIGAAGGPGISFSLPRSECLLTF